jgi:hypothetical protein
MGIIKITSIVVGVLAVMVLIHAYVKNHPDILEKEI